MSYFQLPKTFLYSYSSLEIKSSESTPRVAICNSLAHYMLDIKQKITQYQKEWDIYKKYTNPYEYIHSNIPYKKKCVAKFKPLSRAYFKMIELIHLFRLKDVNGPDGCGSKHNHFYNGGAAQCSTPIRTFHLAEGPGGFIEAIVEMRNNKLDEYTGMTIQDEKQNDYNIPAWKKSKQFMDTNPNVKIENGAVGNGNLLDLENFIYCKEKYSSSIDLITADGGFDFSVDFDNQEVNITKLLFAQIAYALCMQKQGGTFVLKIFDSYMEHTIDLLYLLSSFYDKVYICKPNSSRPANSEKYLVCKNFLFPSHLEFSKYIYNAFYMCVTLPDTMYIHRFLKTPINLQFKMKVEEIISIFGQQQIENIYNTISLIESTNKSEKIDYLLKTHIQKCIHWCMKYNVPHNSLSNLQNGFLNSHVSTNDKQELEQSDESSNSSL